MRHGDGRSAGSAKSEMYLMFLMFKTMCSLWSFCIASNHNLIDKLFSVTNTLADVFSDAV